MSMLNLGQSFVNNWIKNPYAFFDVLIMFVSTIDFCLYIDLPSRFGVFYHKITSITYRNYLKKCLQTGVKSCHHLLAKL